MQEISELMDGELAQDAAGRQVTRMKGDAAQRETWDTYHLIGDALRGERVTGAMSTAFGARMAQALADEPTLLAPKPSVLEKAPRSRTQSWLLSAAASVAAIAVVGGVAFSVMKHDEAPATVAVAPQPKSVVALTAQPAASVATPAAAALVASATAPAGPTAPEGAAHMHEYLLAHQGISPSTAIQGVTPYIRTVSSNSADD